jgi:hypothetical protein
MSGRSAGLWGEDAQALFGEFLVKVNFFVYGETVWQEINN